MDERIDEVFSLDCGEPVLDGMAERRFPLGMASGGPMEMVGQVCGQPCYKEGCPNSCSKRKGHAGAHTCGNH